MTEIKTLEATVEAVECAHCGTLHKKTAQTFITLRGDIMVGLMGGIIGSNFKIETFRPLDGDEVTAATNPTVQIPVLKSTLHFCIGRDGTHTCLNDAIAKALGQAITQREKAVRLEQRR